MCADANVLMVDIAEELQQMWVLLQRLLVNDGSGTCYIAYM